jgi:hypothetical protein
VARIVGHFLTGLFVRVVPSNNTTDSRAKQTVISGIVTGNAAHHSAFETSGGICGAREQRGRKDH